MKYFLENNKEIRAFENLESLLEKEFETKNSVFVIYATENSVFYYGICEREGLLVHKGDNIFLIKVNILAEKERKLYDTDRKELFFFIRERKDGMRDLRRAYESAEMAYHEFKRMNPFADKAYLLFGTCGKKAYYSLSFWRESNETEVSLSSLDDYKNDLSVLVKKRLVEERDLDTL